MRSQCQFIQRKSFTNLKEKKGSNFFSLNSILLQWEPTLGYWPFTGKEHKFFLLHSIHLNSNSVRLLLPQDSESGFWQKFQWWESSQTRATKHDLSARYTEKILVRLETSPFWRVLYLHCTMCTHAYMCIAHVQAS